jgi:phospholipid/cholesterol/gamma-HCH transport system substrate-binding protein
VDEIRFIPVDQRVGDANIGIRLAVNRGVQDQIRRDSRASLKTQGLLGDRFVDIEPGSAAARMLSPGDTLLTIPPIELEEHVLEPLAIIMDDASVTIGGLREVTDRVLRGEGTLGRLLLDDALYLRATASAREVEALLREVRTGRGTLHRLIHDPALYDDLQRALARFDALGREITEAEGTLGLLLRDDALYHRLVGLVESADTVVGELAGFAQRMTEGEGTLHRLLEDPELYDQLLRAVIDFQHLLMQIRAEPREFRPEVNIRLFR